MKSEKFHQNKRRISIKKQILMKQQYLIRSISVKMDLNISLTTKILKKLDLDEYFFQKGVL